MLSERCQTGKVTYYTILFIWNVQKRQTCRDRKVDSYLPGVVGGNED